MLRAKGLALALAALSAPAFAQSLPVQLVLQGPPWEKTVTPSPFAAFPILPTRVAGPGRVEYAPTVQQAFLNAVGGAFVAGSLFVAPANRGTADCLSLPNACSMATARTKFPTHAFVEAGVYPLTDFLRYTDGGAAGGKWWTATGPVTMQSAGVDVTAATWTATGGHANVWQTPNTLANKMLVMLNNSVKDGWGYSTRLPVCTSLATIDAASSCTWNDTVGQLIYAKDGSTDFSVSKANYQGIYGAGTSPATSLIYGAVNALVDGPWTFLGIEIEPFDHTGSIPNFFADGVTVLYSQNYGILSLGGNDYIANTRAHASVSDNLNCKPDGAVLSTSVEIYDWSSFAGDTMSQGLGLSQNRNASSAESGCNMIRIAGLYEDSYGPELADVATVGVAIAYTWDVGVVTRPFRAATTGNAGFGVFGGGDSTLRRQTWIHDGLSYGSVSGSGGGLYVNGPGAAALIHNSNFTNQAIFSTGTISNYDPNAPG